MGSQDVLETTTTFDNTDGVHDLEIKQAAISIEQNDSLEVEFLEDYDAMMEDIDNRLKVARMVSDSMIKGMVSAVEQDADEKIKAKESELETLKRSVNNKSTVDFIRYDSLEDVCLKHDKMKESVTDEFKKLRKQIEGLKSCKLKKNGSCYELVGLGGILKDEYDLEQTLNNLEMMMNNMSTYVETVVTFSKDSLNEWQHKHKMKEKLEDMVIQSSIKCIQEEFQEAEIQSSRLTEKFNNISDLKNELESLTKLLPPSNDSSHLASHSSLDIDATHGNPLRSQLSTRWEENGESAESNPDAVDNFDASSLSHMNKEEMVNFFNNRILNLKREHEAEVHQITDNYISLKGKYLSERRSIVPSSKEFEVLKKKIPEVVVKLDNILYGSDEFIGKHNNVISLNTVLKENRQLRDSFTVMEDKLLEASIVEDVYKCVVNELSCHIQDMKEGTDLQIVAMHDVYEVLLETIGIRAIEDARMESLLTQELLEIVFKETVTDLNRKVENLHGKYITATENLVSLETKLIFEVEEREKLRSTMEESERLAKNEIDNLRNHETLMLKAKNELDETREKLSKAEEKVLSDEMEISSLNKRLEIIMEEMKTLNEYKKMLLELSEEKQMIMSQIEAKEREHRKQMEAVVVLVDELTANFVDFECRVTWDVKDNYTRLENSRTQLSSLVTEANALKNTGIIYKQQLEKKCRDLQMAEEEVDLLGDEVETLFGILEKIYIALDHYSPVLQHYPGVIEILELVRRELSGESLKPRRHL